MKTIMEGWKYKCEHSGTDPFMGKLGRVVDAASDCGSRPGFKVLLSGVYSQVR